MSRSPEEERLFSMARFIRIGVIRNVLMQNYINRDEALDLLVGCLEPGDESTRVDDRELLDKSLEEVMKTLNLKPQDLSNMEDKNA